MFKALKSDHRHRIGGRCDHDGKATGRLLMQAGGIRREISCECGETLLVLGHDRYSPAGFTAIADARPAGVLALTAGPPGAPGSG